MSELHDRNIKSVSTPPPPADSYDYEKQLYTMPKKEDYNIRYEKAEEYGQLYPHLFSSYTIKKTTIKNRIFVAPQGITYDTTPYPDPEGFLSEAGIFAYGDRARGGAAVVTTGEVNLDPLNGRGHNHMINVVHEKSIFTLTQLADYVHVWGGLVSMELTHCGPYALPPYNGGRNPIGPSKNVLPTGVEVDEMDEEEMNRVANCFAHGAQMARRSGFDMCLIHGAHNWLLASFLSPIENRRKDKYGGGLENRARFPIMVVDRIRKTVGPDFILEYRISGSELTDGGLQIDEVCEFLKMIEDKVDIAQISIGMRRNPHTRGIMQPSRFRVHNCNTWLAETVKKSGLKIPVTALGNIDNPRLADQIIAEGKGDFVGMVRSFVADINWAEKARAGKAEDITPCIKCLRCLDVHAGRVAIPGKTMIDTKTGKTVTNANTEEKAVILQDFEGASRRDECSVNPVYGRAHIMHYFPQATRSKKVVIIGGGPSGIQAALEANKRGHKVTIYEKADHLGGQLSHVDNISFKQYIRRYREFLVRQVVKSDIQVKLNSAPTPDMVRMEHPDAVIVAIGADPVIPNIPGVKRDFVTTVVDGYEHEEKVGNKVVIIGGGMVGCESALHFAEHGKDVTLIEMLPWLAAQDTTYTERMDTLYFMRQQPKLKQYLNTTCTEITDKGVKAVGKDGKELYFEAATVLLAAGYKARKEEVAKFYGTAFDVIPVGDCVVAGPLVRATRTGFDAALRIAGYESCPRV